MQTGKTESLFSMKHAFVWTGVDMLCKNIGSRQGTIAPKYVLYEVRRRS